MNLNKMISRDKIQICYFLYQLLGTIVLFCFSRGYYIHSNYGMWVLLSVYWAIMLIYFFLVINIIIKMTYKLKVSHQPMVKVTAMICILGYILVTLLYVVILVTVRNYKNNYKIQLIVIRTINVVFVMVGVFYSIAILYYGGKIEKMLTDNKETNKEQINSVRRIRYSFSIILFLFAMMIYPLFAVFPTLMQWAFTPGLAWGSANLFFIWHTKVIKKKIGTVSSSLTKSISINSETSSPTASTK